MRFAGRHRLVATLLAAAAVGGCLQQSGPAGSSPAVDLTVSSGAGDALVYRPAALAAPAATTLRITFQNASSQAHNLTFQAPISVGTQTIVEAGAAEAISFRTPGPGDYAFVCTIHVDMAGTLTVT